MISSFHDLNTRFNVSFADLMSQLEDEGNLVFKKLCYFITDCHHVKAFMFCLKKFY